MLTQAAGKLVVDPDIKHVVVLMLLLIITYDEHGGCYDHVFPGTAVSPGGPFPDGYRTRDA